MDNKQKKRLMTDVANGKITMKKAEELMNPDAQTKNKISPDFIGDDPETMREGTITPLENTKTKLKIGGKKDSK